MRIMGEEPWSSERALFLFGEGGAGVRFLSDALKENDVRGPKVRNPFFGVTGV